MLISIKYYYILYGLLCYKTCFPIFIQAANNPTKSEQGLKKTQQFSRLLAVDQCVDTTFELINRWSWIQNISKNMPLSQLIYRKKHDFDDQDWLMSKISEAILKDYQYISQIYNTLAVSYSQDSIDYKENQERLFRISIGVFSNAFEKQVFDIINKNQIIYDGASEDAASVIEIQEVLLKRRRAIDYFSINSKLYSINQLLQIQNQYPCKAIQQECKWLNDYYKLT